MQVSEDPSLLSPDSTSRPRYHSLQTGIGPRPTGKDIFVFCDGTGKDGYLETHNRTNIWRLYQLILSQQAGDYAGWGPSENSMLRQYEVGYFPGIGSGRDRNPYNLLVRLFGTTIFDHILQVYLYVATHYEAGSKIYLFGYSRGALVVRKVAGLIYRIGVIREREKLLKLWDHRERPVPWNLINSPPRGSAIPIQALVVWDTMSAIRSVHPKSKMEVDILRMPDEELPPNVNHAFHAVAFHENRKLFRPTLFKHRRGGIPSQPGYSPRRSQKLTDDRQLKIIDFGSAFLHAYNSLQFSISSHNPGMSLRWTAPEVIIGDTGPTKEADIYSLGMTMFEVFTKSIPHGELNECGLYEHIVEKMEFPKRPKNLYSHLVTSNYLWSLFTECWAHSPQKRPLAGQVHDKMISLLNEALNVYMEAHDGSNEA